MEWADFPRSPGLVMGRYLGRNAAGKNARHLGDGKRCLVREMAKLLVSL